MDSTTQLAATLGVPLIIYIGAELVKRSTSLGQSKIDDKSKFLTQVQDALEKERMRSDKCEEARRRQDMRQAVMEYAMAQIGAEASITISVAEEIAVALEDGELKTDARRLLLSATRLRQLAQKPTEELEEQLRGIGSREDI